MRSRLYVEVAVPGGYDNPHGGNIGIEFFEFFEHRATGGRRIRAT